MGQAKHASVTYDNTNRVVLVTGGANGIGRAIAEAFLQTGAHVGVIDVAAPAEPLDDRVRLYQADTRDDQQFAQIVADTVECFGAIDVLVNNAAIQPPDSYRPIHEYSSDLWQRMLDINLTGYTICAKHVLRQMKLQQHGVIINIASGQGHRTARGVPAYGPIKAANIMQAKQWGLEYARDGIRVVSVSPGAINTPLVRSTLEAQGGEAELANRHPLGRIGRPEEVAAAVLWLASDDASFVTATDLEVDGGLGAFGSFADPYPREDDS